MTTLQELKQIGRVSRGGFPWWLIHRKPAGKTVVLVPREEDVFGVVDDVTALFHLPRNFGRVHSFGIRGYPVDDEPERQRSLYEWIEGSTEVLVSSREGWETPCDEPARLRQRTLRLKPGLTMGRHPFEDVLSQAGYSRNERPEEVGDYSVRGEVMDIWPPGEESPIRVIWDLDTVEALRPVNLYTQRSEGYRREVLLYAVTTTGRKTLADIVDDRVHLVIFATDPAAADWPNESLRERSCVVGPFESVQENWDLRSPPSFLGQMEALREQLIRWNEDDWRGVVYCHNEGEKERLNELLQDPLKAVKGAKEPWLPTMVIGELEHGFVDPHFRLAVLANSEFFGRYRKRVRLPKFEGGGALSSALDIGERDYLVHERHGIGRYRGLRSLRVGEVVSEYLMIEYKGGDKLYVPIFEIQQVQKYLGAEGRRPSLSSLDTPAWERIKSKVKEDVAKLAADLLNQAAKRSVRPGFAFPETTHLEKEFGASFLYSLTPDQKKTLAEVESDMISPKVMDRLICGDVGFGKTEIAMRAALKCALAAKQVGLLCPTTLLAEQHARNFSERLAEYPVTIKLLSRFQDKREQRDILRGLSAGGVDVVIGTHRLLSHDVHFKDLGLIVIDEEHRFGVRQKTKLLNLRETVDVLSLTATPIPRTLASSLAGIKNLSVIETAPEGRLPISTHVGLFDEELMVKAVHEELDRGGQVFYVHNRVKTLDARRQWLEGVLPQIRIGFAHGRMDERQLEKTMHDFLYRKIDVLLSTTIIESGLDIPSVNTLIVEEAEEMGLAQLYQLRGRVGRSRARAYCYLFYSGSSMTQEAKKRLEALKEFTSLGSGLRLAMRDMEIRGAGNLLGSEQHGSMAAVGIETYSRFLQDEIRRIKGEDLSDSLGGPVLEVSLSAYIPEDYLPSERERIATYKRLMVSSEKDLGKLKEELVDRCGPLPEPTKLLFDAASLRLLLKKKGVSEVHQGPGEMLIYFRQGVKIPDKSFEHIISGELKSVGFVQGPPAGLRIAVEENKNALDVLGWFLRTIMD